MQRALVSNVHGGSTSGAEPVLMGPVVCLIFVYFKAATLDQECCFFTNAAPPVAVPVVLASVSRVNLLALIAVHSWIEL